MGNGTEALLGEFTGRAAALTAAFLWAVAVIFYHRAGRYLHPLALNLAKGVIALGLFVVALAAFGLIWEPVGAGAWVLLLVSGACGIGLGDTALFHSLNRVGPRRALLLMLTAPPLTALIAFLFLGEKLALKAWLGIFVTVAGVAWVITERTEGEPAEPGRMWPGIVFGLVAAAGQAAGGVLSRAALDGTTVNPMWSALPRLLGGIAVILAVILATRRPLGAWARTACSPPVRRWVIIATFIGTFLGIWMLQVSLKFARAGIAQTLLATSPAFALIIGRLTGEKVSVRAALGVAVAFGGVAFLFGLV